MCQLHSFLLTEYISGTEVGGWKLGGAGWGVRGGGGEGGSGKYLGTPEIFRHSLLSLVSYTQCWICFLKLKYP